MSGSLFFDFLCSIEERATAVVHEYVTSLGGADFFQLEPRDEVPWLKWPNFRPFFGSGFISVQKSREEVSGTVHLDIFSRVTAAIPSCPRRPRQPGLTLAA